MVREEPDANGRIPVARRPLVKGAGVALAGLALSGAGATAAQTDDDTELSGPSSRPTLGDLGAETDDGETTVPGGGEFTTHMHLDGDPSSGGDRERVVHVTSDGAETMDYAASLVNVENQGVTVGEVAGSDGTLEYDFYAGSASTNAVPDEVFIVVDTVVDETEVIMPTGGDSGSETSDDGDDEDLVTVAYRTQDAGADGEWGTRNVAAELTQTGWRDVSVPVEQLESGDMLLPVGIALRDREVEAEPPLERYGEDTRLLGVGFGQGFTTQEVVVDAYYDDLTVGGGEAGDGTWIYEFPAVVPVGLTVEQRGNGALQASFELTQEEAGVALSDVEEDSIGLWPYDPVTAFPPTSDGAGVRGVRAGADEVAFVVPPNELDAFDSGEQPVIVSGTFEVEEGVVAFGGVDTLDLSV